MYRVRLFALSIIMLVAVVALAQVDWASMSPDEQQEMMQKWQELATPTAAHELLQPMVGNWKTTTSMWMAGPDGPPMISEGESVKTMALGGRWLQEDYSGTMMGQPFNGRGMTGYDNYKNMYINTWQDDMSTALTYATGMRHAETGVFTFHGLTDEPMLDVQDRAIKYTYVIESNDKHVFTMYDLHAGDDFKVFEIVYERAK